MSGPPVEITRTDVDGRKPDATGQSDLLSERPARVGSLFPSRGQDSNLAEDPTSPIGHLTKSRYVPVLVNRKIRTAMGLLIGVVSVALLMNQAGSNGIGQVLVLFGVAWLAAISLTDKYTHKHPYRYYAYLVASHAKAGAIMAALLALAVWTIGPFGAIADVIWQSFGWFVLADFVVSIPRRREPLTETFDPSILASREVGAQANPAVVSETEDSEPHGASDGQMAFADVAGDLDDALVAHIRSAVPGFHDGLTAAVIEDRYLYKRRSWTSAPVDLIISRVRINDLQRINRFFIACGDGLRMGGHLVCQYEPLGNNQRAIKKKYGKLFWPAYLMHFAWYRAFPKIPVLNVLYFVLTHGKNRELSKAEVWGRLSFCGLKVVSEEEAGEDRLVTAQRIALPITNRKPSYYPVVGLSKVGLDGQIMRTHKVRSMYPYSEFLQKQIFDDNGLVGTGKFKNDFRLTEYGKYLRRYWIDELPQFYDWFRGDIKLAGLRATSPHFLSLYPKEFIDLYVRVKPGLVPPLFPEGTDGFREIVEIELDYLQKYVRAPSRTDFACLWDTFKLIVFHGVRSK